MTNPLAILSMLHEPPDRCSATRLFRGEPVLRWTIDRLTRSSHLGSIAVLCWEDQLAAVTPVAEEERAYVLAKGPRVALPEVESVAAARRWADGWRGGLLATCHFDLGFYAPWHHELAQHLESDGVLLIDPSAALIDPAILDDLIAQANEHPDVEVLFAPAAPGLGGALVRPELLNRLAAAKVHPGRLMHYHPDQVSREPLAGDGCVAVPTAAARTTHRFTLDSDRQIERISEATESLNGQLLSSGAEELVRRVQACKSADPLPREILLELNTDRATSPIFSPTRHLKIARPAFTVDQARQLFAELAGLDDTRLTLAGVGDPLLAPEVFTIIDAAKLEAGVAIHVETDLLDISPEQIARLASSPVDVVSVHLPALTAQTYAAVMGVDGFARVIENIRKFVAERQARQAAVPLLVPTFIKCHQNLAEMESWYDQWLRAVGSAVIHGPSDCAGQIPDVSVADMSPPGRKPCSRLSSRLTILSDGSIVSCEEDVLAKQVLGRIGVESLHEVWSKRAEALRADHRESKWERHPLCARCREWHRP
jgi:radical SAM protein with 4Fe4S-binding SPASM domain